MQYPTVPLLSIKCSRYWDSRILRYCACLKKSGNISLLFNHVNLYRGKNYCASRHKKGKYRKMSKKKLNLYRTIEETTKWYLSSITERKFLHVLTNAFYVAPWFVGASQWHKMFSNAREHVGIEHIASRFEPDRVFTMPRKNNRDIPVRNHAWTR